jgi:hypothetical protein
MSNKISKIFIDPSYDVFNNNQLFNLNNKVLNRDDQLMPFSRLKNYLTNNSKSIDTADLMPNDSNIDNNFKYFSLGILSNYKKILLTNRATLSAFIIMEPPVVAPHLYAALPELTAVFERVYLHNIEGDGYSLDKVIRGKLHRLYWPIPYAKVLTPFWENENRKKRIVVINGNHNPRSRSRELYSKRIEAMVELKKFHAVDLYGQGWSKWWSREAFWKTYFLNRNSLMSIYKGPCISKFEVLKNYEFCLCFENMEMNGYITEKIFDCLYAGTIPLYLGAPDISKYIPNSAYIDCREFSSWNSMWDYVKSLSNSKIKSIKEAGRNYLGSESAKSFYNSLEKIVI